MLIYSSNIAIFSINCVQFNILFELDIFVVSRLFDMSKTLYYKTLRKNVRETKGKSTMGIPEKLSALCTQDTRHKTKTNKSKTQHNMLWTPL
jgi:hypothetical protein